MRPQVETPAARAFREALDQPQAKSRARARREPPVTLLAVASALLLVVLAVRFGIVPLMEATERVAMASERKRVQVALEAYRMLDRLADTPARAAPRRILPGDSDAPFARFLEGATRYSYRWFEDGQGLHAVGKEPDEALRALAVAALAHDLLQASEAPVASGWQAQLQARLRLHMAAGDALGLANPVSGSVEIRRLADPATDPAMAPAVLISDAPIHTFGYLAQQRDAGLAGSIVVCRSESTGEAEVFLVRPQGDPAYLLLAGGAGIAPRRGRGGW